MPEEKLDLTKFDSIFIYSLNYIGDTLFTTPVFRAVKELNPNIKLIAVVGKKGGYQILKDNPYVDTIIEIEKGVFNSIKQIKSGLGKDSIPKISIILENDFKSALICFLLGINYRIGINSEFRGFLLTHRTVTNSTHIVDKYFDNLQFFSDDIKCKGIEFFINNEEIANSSLTLPDKQTIKIAISPSTTNLNKKYSDDNYIKFINELLSSNNNIEIYLIGGNDSNASAEYITNKINNKRLHNFVCKTGSLNELAYLLNQMNFVIGSDTGPLHIANALRVPTLYLFSVSSPLKTGPYNKKNSKVILPPDNSKNINSISPYTISNYILKNL
ncbi:MAG: glycosyltransferase family 9 protein [Spirochaetota bacterium]